MFIVSSSPFLSSSPSHFSPALVWVLYGPQFLSEEPAPAWALHGPHMPHMSHLPHSLILDFTGLLSHVFFLTPQCLCGILPFLKHALTKALLFFTLGLSCALLWGCCGMIWTQLCPVWSSPWSPLTEATPAALLLAPAPNTYGYFP